MNEPLDHKEPATKGGGSVASRSTRWLELYRDTEDRDSGASLGVGGSSSGETTTVPVLMTVEQAAKALSIGRTTAFKLIENGALRSLKIGRLRRVPVDAVENFTRGEPS